MSVPLPPSPLGLAFVDALKDQTRVYDEAHFTETEKRVYDALYLDGKTHAEAMALLNLKLHQVARARNGIQRKLRAGLAASLAPEIETKSARAASFLISSETQEAVQTEHVNALRSASGPAYEDAPKGAVPFPRLGDKTLDELRDLFSTSYLWNKFGIPENPDVYEAACNYFELLPLNRYQWETAIPTLQMIVREPELAPTRGFPQLVAFADTIKALRIRQALYVTYNLPNCDAVMKPAEKLWAEWRGYRPNVTGDLTLDDVLKLVSGAPGKLVDHEIPLLAKLACEVTRARTGTAIHRDPVPNLVLVAGESHAAHAFKLTFNGLPSTDQIVVHEYYTQSGVLAPGAPLPDPSYSRSNEVAVKFGVSIQAVQILLKDFRTRYEGHLVDIRKGRNSLREAPAIAAATEPAEQSSVTFTQRAVLQDLLSKVSLMDQTLMKWVFYPTSLGDTSGLPYGIQGWGSSQVINWISKTHGVSLERLVLNAHRIGLSAGRALQEAEGTSPAPPPVSHEEAVFLAFRRAGARPERKLMMLLYPCLERKPQVTERQRESLEWLAGRLNLYVEDVEQMKYRIERVVEAFELGG